MRDHVVGRAVEDGHGRVVSVDVVGGVERLEALLVALEGEAHHGLLGSVVPGVLGGAAAHVVEIHGAGPVEGRVHAAAELEVAAHVAFQLLHAAARSSQRGEVTAGREAGRGHEGSVKAILVSIGAHPADDALDVLDLGRELGVLRGTVVRADDGIAGVQQGVHDGAEVGHALGVVGVPGAAVDVDHDRVGVLLHTRQINVQLVVNLVVTRIVDVLELLGAVDVELGHLEAAEAAGGLGLQGDGPRQACDQKQYLFHH